MQKLTLFLTLGKQNNNLPLTSSEWMNGAGSTTQIPRRMSIRARLFGDDKNDD
jgi:hypothetical protein